MRLPQVLADAAALQQLNLCSNQQLVLADADVDGLLAALPCLQMVDIWCTSSDAAVVARLEAALAERRAAV